MIAVIRRASHRNAVEISLSTSSSILFYLVTHVYAAPTHHSSRSVHFTISSLLLDDYSNTMYLIWRIF